MIVTDVIKLQISKPNFDVVVFAKQFDTDSRFIKCYLYSGKESVSVSSGAVLVNMRREIGAGESYEGEINEDGSVTVPLTSHFLSVAGMSYCSVTVVDDNEKLSTTSFIVIVQEAENVGADAYKFPFMGENAELISEDESTYKLSDIGYDSWTPSTSVSILRDSELLKTINANFAKFAYYIEFMLSVDYKYEDGYTPISTLNKQVVYISSYMLRRPYSVSDLESDNNYLNSAVNNALNGYFDYFGSSGGRAAYMSGAYGVYFGTPASTVANNTADETTISVNIPPINARCSTTYFTVDGANHVDSDASKIKLRCRIYRIDPKDNFARAIISEISKYYNEI